MRQNAALCGNWLSAYLSYHTFVSSPEHEVHRVSYCDNSLSVGICPSSVHIFLFTLQISIYNIYKHQSVSTRLGQNII